MHGPRCYLPLDDPDGLHLSPALTSAWGGEPSGIDNRDVRAAQAPTQYEAHN